MANINLLPWREEQRAERNRATLMGCVLIWLIAGAIVFGAKMFMDGKIQHQENRNAYLQSEINALAAIIKEIEDLKDKRDELLARMEVIQSLQANRSQIVHVFDDLVTKLPNGVYYENIKKTNGRLRITGNAQSNGRVSALMRNLDASDWFDNTSLAVVDVIDRNGAPVSQFDVQVAEERKDSSNQDNIESVR